MAYSFNEYDLKAILNLSLKLILGSILVILGAFLAALEIANKAEVSDTIKLLNLLQGGCHMLAGFLISLPVYNLRNIAKTGTSDIIELMEAMKKMAFAFKMIFVLILISIGLNLGILLINQW
jgi:hypothetical protein